MLDDSGVHKLFYQKATLSFFLFFCIYTGEIVCLLVSFTDNLLKIFPFELKNRRALGI